MWSGCQYSRWGQGAARSGSRKLEKMGRESALLTRKIPARNPELEILLGGGKVQSSDLASLGKARKAVLG